MASVLIVGVDVSKARLHLALVAPGKTQATFLDTFPNDTAFFNALAEALSMRLAQEGAESLHLILEPTGGYEQPFAHYAHQQGSASPIPPMCVIGQKAAENAPKPTDWTPVCWRSLERIIPRRSGNRFLTTWPRWICSSNTLKDSERPCANSRTDANRSEPVASIRRRSLKVWNESSRRFKRKSPPWRPPSETIRTNIPL